MTRISSRFTFFFKRVFPAFWFGFLAIFLAAAFFNSAFEGFVFLLAAPVIAALIGYIVFRKLVWNLVDAVDDGGDFLLVRNRGEEERIPLARIAGVNEWLWMNPPRVTLELSAPGKFGNAIAFLPQYRLKPPFGTSPITKDLIERIRRS